MRAAAHAPKLPTDPASRSLFWRNRGPKCVAPSHEYKVAGKTAAEVFSGPIASLMEELKAQTGALFLIEFLRGKKIITDEEAARTYIDAIVWAFGHTSQGTYTGGGDRKTYSNHARSRSAS